MLTRVLVREDDETITPRSILKWYEVDYDVEACAVLSSRLNKQRAEPLEVDHFRILHDDIYDYHAQSFSEAAAELVEKIYPSRKVRKKKKLRQERETLEAEVERLSRSMEGFANRMFENKHIYRYGLVALSELQHLSNLLRETVINEIFEFFHSNAPMTNDKLLAGVQDIHASAHGTVMRFEFVRKSCSTNCVTSSTAITCARMRNVLSTLRRPDTAAAIC